MTNHEILERLRALGTEPVDPAVASRHHLAMAAAQPRRGWLSRRLQVGVAVAAGALVASTGLASAGALGPVQSVAHTTLKSVGVHVPKGKALGHDKQKADKVKAHKAEKADDDGEKDPKSTAVHGCNGYDNASDAGKAHASASSEGHGLKPTPAGCPTTSSTVKTTTTTKVPPGLENKPAAPGGGENEGKRPTTTSVERGPDAPPQGPKDDHGQGSGQGAGNGAGKGSNGSDSGTAEAPSE